MGIGERGVMTPSQAVRSVLWVRPEESEPLLIATCDASAMPEGFEIGDAWGIPVLLRSTEREQIRAMRIEYLEGPSGGFVLDRTPPVGVDPDRGDTGVAGACTSCASAALPPHTLEVQPDGGTRRGPSLPVVAWTPR